MPPNVFKGEGGLSFVQPTRPAVATNGQAGGLSFSGGQLNVSGLTESNGGLFASGGALVIE